MMRNILKLALAALSLAVLPTLVLAQSGISASFLGAVDSSAVSVDATSPRLERARPQLTAVAPAAPVISFSPASVGISAVSAQTLVASFAVSGYSGSFTPTAALHYGHDYSLGTVSCTPSGSTETCTAAVSFNPILPGIRRDAIFLTEGGGARLATVQLGGTGEAPLALIQPGSVVSTLASTPADYNYNSTVDENGTVYSLTNNATTNIVQIDKTGTVSWLPIAGNHSLGGIAIDGAGVLYIGLYGYGDHLLTYDTVTGAQGTLAMVPPAYTPCAYASNGNSAVWYFAGVATDEAGNVYANEMLCQVVIERKVDGTFATYPLNPRMTQLWQVAVDSAGNIFPSGYSINKIVPGGTQSRINSAGATDGIAIDAADSLYATRYQTGPGLMGIAVLPASDYTTFIAALEQTVDPLGESLGVDGTVYVGNYNTVDKIDRSQGLLDFATQNVGVKSAVKTAGIYNGGDQSLTLSNIAVSGDGYSFVASPSNGCTSTMTLAPGAFCNVDVTVTPTHAGNILGSVVFTSNSLNGSGVTQTVALKAAVQGAYLTATPSAIDFGNVPAGSTSAAQTVTLTDTGIDYSGLGDPSLGVATVPNSVFSVDTSQCAGIVANSAKPSCPVSVTFKPAATAPYSGTVTIPYTSSLLPAASSVSFTVAGNGGTSGANVTPAFLTFGSLDTGLSSPVNLITVTNNGTAPLHISAIALGGSNPSQFQITAAGSCSNSTPVATGGSCTVSILFAPTVAGSFTASLLLADDAPGSPHSVALSGTGTVPQVISLSPATLDFGSQIVNTTSARKLITLTNTSSTNTLVEWNAASGDPAFNLIITGCMSPIAPGGSCTLSVDFTPSAVQSYTAAASIQMIEVGCGGCGSTFTQTLPLTGTGIAAPPIMSASPAILDFGNQIVNFTSARKSVTLTNTSSVYSVIEWAFATGNSVYTADLASCSSPIPAGGSCTVPIDFTPTATQTYSATASFQMIQTSCGSSACITFPTQTFAITGTGIPVPPVMSLSPAALDFGNQIVKTTSVRKTITLTNTSSANTLLEWSAASGGPAFNLIVTGCMSPIAPRGSCTLSVEFTPSAVQSYTATASIQMIQVDCGGCGTTFTQTFTLTGTGIAPPPIMSVTPTTLDFGNQIVGSTSAQKSITLTNTSSVYSVIEWSFTTGNSVFKPYILSCINPIPPGGSCTVPVDFTPTAAQAYNATASFQMIQTSCGSSGCITFPAQTFTIAGVGVNPSVILTPSPLDFGSVGVGPASPIKYVTLSNTGASALTITNITVGGALVFMQSGGSCSIATPVAAGTSCTIGLTFQTNIPGAYSGTLTVTDNDASSQQTVALTGTGIIAADFGLSATPSTQTVVGGSTATYSIAIPSVGGSFDSAVALSISGLPAGATALFSPATVTPGAAGATSTLTIQTVPLVAVNSPLGFDPRSTALSSRFFLCVGFLPLLFIRRIHRLRINLSLALAIFLALWGAVGISGCAVPASAPQPQTSSITITATSAAIGHTTTVQLTVQ